MRGELVDGGETRAQWREREREEGRNGDRGYGGRGGAGADKDAFLKQLPAGAPLPPGTSSLDMISQTLATMNPAQLIEVLAQMKVRLLLMHRLVREDIAFQLLLTNL